MSAPAPTSAATPTPLAIHHNTAARRFEATVEGLLCVATYRRDGDRVDFDHTVVPPALSGRGIAAALVREALAWARAEGLAVDTSCSYVATYRRRHPDA